MKRKIEIFTAGCPTCEPIVEKVKGLACENCEVIVYNLNEKCEADSCTALVKKYGINRMPAVVVDGRLLDCCKSSAVDEGLLRAAGIGKR